MRQIATFIALYFAYAHGSLCNVPKETKLNVFLYYFVLCGLFFPVNYVTLVRVLTFFHLNNTRSGIIITFTSSMIPFCVFTIRNFVISVPVSWTRLLLSTAQAR